MAVRPPDDVLDAVAAAVEPGRSGPVGLRWTGREQWHLTLQFLGDVRHHCINHFREDRQRQNPALIRVGIREVRWLVAQVRISGVKRQSLRIIQNGGNTSVGEMLFALGIPLACWFPWIAIALYTCVAVLWLVPDRRIEKVLVS